MSKKILSYCNQPIFKVDGKYYTAHANFIDFMCFWTARDHRSRIMVPVSVADSIESCWVELNLKSAQVIPAYAYKTHFGAILCGFLNAFKFRRHIGLHDKQFSEKFCIVIPSPNALGATLSFITGRGSASRMLTVVRGNSLKTVSHMYRKRRFGSLALLISRFFYWRLTILQKKGAVALCFGDDLKKIHSSYGRCLSIYPLINSVSRFVRASQGRDKNKPITMLFLGRLSYEKGLIELFDALENLVEGGHVFKMLIGGHGPLQAHVESRSSSAILNPFVTFVGRLSPGKEVFELIDKSDIFLLPSKTEGVPRVIVESLSRGVPVLTTAVGGIPTTFGDSVAYFKSTAPDDIANGISAFLRDPSLLDTFNYGDSTALRRFTFDHNIKRIEDLAIKKVE